MEFLNAFDYWSVLHCLGSCVLTMTLGTLNLNIGPAASGVIVLGMGVGWEVVMDETFQWNDLRGGDYYDVFWDLAGCALGVALLEATEKYQPIEGIRDYNFGGQKIPIRQYLTANGAPSHPHFSTRRLISNSQSSPGLTLDSTRVLLDAH